MSGPENVLRASGKPVAGSGDPLTRHVDEAPQRLGRSSLATARHKLFGYDRVEGMARSARIVYGIDVADRMSVEEAAKMLHVIHEAFKMNNQAEEDIYAHDQAMFICYAFNGASTIGPYERAGYRIISENGAVSQFDYSVVQRILGVSMRRFFRAFANEVVDACRQLYEQCDFTDPDMVELREHMIQVADRRASSRYPYLIGDCVEAATNLSANERASKAASKVAVVGGTSNAVDRRNIAKTPVRSMDNYDSSVAPGIAEGPSGGDGSHYYN